MTLRLTLGVDPGQTGAIAAIADGVPVGFIDMPTVERKAGGQQVDAEKLGADLRALIAKHHGAYVYGVIEQVNALPKQGSASGFRFGQSDGIARGVLGALGIRLISVPPQTWKRYLRLTGLDKDAARLHVIQRYPALADQLKRKKDVGRADALLVALWAELTEQVARKAA